MTRPAPTVRPPRPTGRAANDPRINPRPVAEVEIVTESVDAQDWVGEFGGVKVLVDPKSLPYIDGTELDFVREGLNEGFKFHNPREKDRCGCGESFRV